MDYKIVHQDFKNADQTVFEALYEASKRYKDNYAIGFMGRDISYTDLVKGVEKTALALIEAGVKQGDAVTFMLPNCPQAVMVYYAISRIGAVSNMIHTMSSSENIAFYMNKAKSRFIVMLDTLYPKIKEATEKLNHDITVIYTSIADEMPAITKIGYKLKTMKNKPEKITDPNAVSLKDLLKKSKGGKLPEITYEKDRLSTIFYSGGSTGTPKGICLSDYNMNSLGIQVANSVGYKVHPGQKFLAAMPLFHGFGLGVGIHAFMLNGSQSVLVPQFTLDAYVKTMLKEKTNMMAIVPTMLEAFLHTDAFDGKDLSFLMGIYCGADAASPDLQKRVNAFLKEHNCKEVVREGFGLTEAVTACILNPRENVKIGSVGVPMGETKVRIVKPGTFEDVAVGGNGEMIICGPSVMMGYLDEPEETAKTLRKDIDGKIWLFTGDMCKKDEDGYIYYIQRIKRMIITGGYNVYPTQVEAVVNDCESVKASCVVGVKDKLMGQTVAACVVLEKDADEKKARTEIMKSCKHRLEGYAVPSKIEFLTELPLTNMGKIDFTTVEKIQNEKAGKTNA